MRQKNLVHFENRKYVEQICVPTDASDTNIQKGLRGILQRDGSVQNSVDRDFNLISPSTITIFKNSVYKLKTQDPIVQDSVD